MSRYTIYCTLLLICLASRLFAATPACRYYTGIMGKSTAIQAELTVTGTAVTGWYFYESFGSHIALRGTVDKTGAVTLKEYTVNPQGAEVVSGIIAGAFDAKWRSCRGNWSNPAGAHKMPLALNAVAEYHELDNQLKTKNGALVKQSGHYPEFLVSTPMLEKVSRLQRDLVISTQKQFVKDTTATAKAKAEYTETMNVDVHYFGSRLIGVFVAESRGAGAGGHITTDIWSANYALDGKEPAVLSLSKLFDTKKNSTGVLSGLIIEELTARKKAMKSNEIIPSKLETGQLANFILTPKAIRFIFPYNIAAGETEDTHTVSIPFSKLSAIMKPDSPLGKLLPVVGKKKG